MLGARWRLRCPAQGGPLSPSPSRPPWESPPVLDAVSPQASAPLSGMKPAEAGPRVRATRRWLRRILQTKAWPPRCALPSSLNPHAPHTSLPILPHHILGSKNGGNSSHGGIFITSTSERCPTCAWCQAPESLPPAGHGHHGVPAQEPSASRDRHSSRACSVPPRPAPRVCELPHPRCPLPAGGPAPPAHSRLSLWQLTPEPNRLEWVVLKFLFVSMGLGSESGRAGDGRGGWESRRVRVRVRLSGRREAGARGWEEGWGQRSLSAVRSQVRRRQRQEDTGSGRDGGG